MNRERSDTQLPAASRLRAALQPETARTLTLAMSNLSPETIETSYSYGLGSVPFMMLTYRFRFDAVRSEF